MAESMVTRVEEAIKREDAALKEAEAKGNFLVPDFRHKVLARAAIEAMREPPEPDAEVWHCPCCDQFVDRETMAALAETKEDPHG